MVAEKETYNPLELAEALGVKPWEVLEMLKRHFPMATFWG